MATFLAIHARYQDVQLGLFDNENLVAQVADESKQISRNLFILFQELLDQRGYSFDQLDFIAAHQGPAPFTTLRVCLASVNGLAFATGKPLIGVNGIKAFIEEYKQNDTVTIALLNAFCQEVYYAIADPALPEILIGYAPATSFIAQLAKEYTDNLVFIGNGALMYKEMIHEYIGNRATIEDVELVSLKIIGTRAYDLWLQHETAHQLMPLYLKSYSTR